MKKHEELSIGVVMETWAAVALVAGVGAYLVGCWMGVRP